MPQEQQWQTTALSDHLPLAEAEAATVITALARRLLLTNRRVFVNGGFRGVCVIVLL